MKQTFSFALIFIFLFIFCGSPNETFAVNPKKVSDEVRFDSECTDCIQCPSEISINYPSFSPDGRFIVFRGRCRNSKSIYRIRTDGSELRKLTQPFGTCDTDPIYSPDGQRILFSSCFTKISCADLCMMNADGLNPTWLTKDGTGGFEPVFSNNGKIIYSVSSCPGGDYFRHEYLDIYTVNTDGTDRKKFIDLKSIVIHNLSLSPDGKNLLFKRRSYDTSLQNDSLWIYFFGQNKVEPLKPDVTEYVRGKKPFRDYSNFAYPRYSPDGKYILFVWPGYYQGYAGHELYIMDTISLRAKKITDLRGFVCDPVFSPDGKKIVFTFEKDFRSDKLSFYELWIINSDGSDPKKIELKP